MTKLTDEEKKQAIEQFIETHQKKFFRANRASKALDVCSEDTLKSWTKAIYGKTPKDLFSERGVIVSEEERLEVARKAFDQLKTAYSGKQPAESEEQLIVDNPGIAADVYLCSLGSVQPLIEPEYDFYEAMRCGIVTDPVASDEGLKKEMEKAVSSFKNRKTVLSLRTIAEEFPLPYFMSMYASRAKYVKYVFNRIRDTFGKSAEEYFTETGCLYPKNKAMSVFRSEFAKLKKQETGKKYEMPINILYHSDKTFTADLINYMYDKAESKGLVGEAADAYVDQLFIDAGLKEGTMTPSATLEAEKQTAAAKKAEEEKAAKEAARADLYDDIDAVDIEELARRAGVSGRDYPADKQPKVNVDGKTFTVQFGLKRNISVFYVAGAKDGKAAYETMLTREQVQERIEKEDPNFRSDAYDLATPEFSEGNRISDETAERRFLFLKAVGAMLQQPDILEALVRFAPKKKNGTFYKNRVVRIASSMVAHYPNTVFEITGRLKDDTRMYVAFEEAAVTPENYEKSRDDFVSNNWEMFI